jgi:hypothetical protein
MKAFKTERFAICYLTHYAKAWKIIRFFMNVSASVKTLEKPASAHIP